MNKHKKRGDHNMKIHRCKRCNYLYVDEEQEIPFKEDPALPEASPCRSAC